jgi:hypothetical protein
MRKKYQFRGIARVLKPGSLTSDYGHIQSMPAFDPDTLARATAKV